MKAYIVTAIVGLVCILLGISNMRGNISTIHSYHRHRVSEKDRIPFGKTVGLGVILCGVSVSLFGVLAAISLYAQVQIFLWIGSGILILGLIAGLGISFYGMIKYNKGIF